ncbi:MAG: methyltransferase type 11 [Gammaproteobacteria bacterium RBG_16_57_12]|nr:MAG: methyltransferase type 11 [Gammaproteobacteria bacterium RBG_16_57_12]
MKVRESGMPEEGLWQGFFDPRRTLHLLDLDSSVNEAVDLGCGYGTFTIPAAQLALQIHAFDIEPDMIETTRRKAQAQGITNIRYHRRDFVLQGTGLLADSVDYVMLFNILHAENPRNLLRETHRILRPAGKVGIMHWNYDPETPRGPPMRIRPRPEQCRKWAEQEGFIMIKPFVDLPPYHYGMVGQKGEAIK